MPTSNVSFAAFALLALPPCLVAQEREPDPEVLLSLETTWHEFVWKVHELLPVEIDPDLPDVDDGDQLELSFTSDGRLRLGAGKPGPEVLVLHARPPQLKRVLKEEAGLIFRMMRALAFTHFVVRMHAEPRYVARAMKAVTDFPNQVEKLDVVARRRAGFPGGLAIEAELEPRKGTWFAKVVAGVDASHRGAHLLRTPNAAMSIAAAVEGPALGSMIGPFGDMLASLRGRSKAERAAFRTFMKQRVQAFDGSFSLLIDGPGRYVRMVGVRDPGDYERRAATDVGLAFDTRRVGRPPVQVVDELPEPLESSPLKWLKKEEDFFEAVTEKSEYELATFSGVVRDFSVKVRLPDDGAEVARLVERIEKKRLRRLPLLKGALVVAQLDFGDDRLRKIPRSELLDDALLRQFGAQLVGGVLDAFPDQITFAVYKRGGKLQLQALTR